MKQSSQLTTHDKKEFQDVLNGKKAYYSNTVNVIDKRPGFGNCNEEMSVLVLLDKDLLTVRKSAYQGGNMRTLLDKILVSSVDEILELVKKSLNN